MTGAATKEGPPCATKGWPVTPLVTTGSLLVDKGLCTNMRGAMVAGMLTLEIRVASLPVVVAVNWSFADALLPVVIAPHRCTPRWLK